MRIEPACCGRLTSAWWGAPAILLLAIPLSLLVGAWALLVWLLLVPLGRRHAPEPR
jgi:hypothetical protein